MNKLVEAYLETLGPDTYDHPEHVRELERQLLDMAQNQVRLLQHVADLTRRVEVLEKRGKTRIIGIN